MNTFRVGDKQIEDYFRKSRRQMQPWLMDRNVKEKVKGETLHASDVWTVGGTSPLFHAVSYAFNNHCPLVITPDSVWLTILTGLSHHIDTDPEGMRKHFVQHEGRKTITVVVDASSLRSISGETWESIIHGGPGIISASFAAQLKDMLNPKKFDLLACGFSTTTPADRISSEVALMGAMKHWFEYKMMLLCGLTTVTVTGTSADWADICARVRVFEEFGLGWWTQHLLPVLDQINLSCQGKPDIEFWKAAYLRHRKGSGGDSNVTGWINAFYPYVASSGRGAEGTMARNRHIAWKSDSGGLDSEDFPLGLVSAPVEANENGKIYKCEFYGGLVGVSMMGDELTVEPKSGYAMQLLEG